jgi:hypothetical protein
MSFKSDTLILITPLDPRERARYTELVKRDVDSEDDWRNTQH